MCVWVSVLVVCVFFLFNMNGTVLVGEKINLGTVKLSWERQLNVTTDKFMPVSYSRVWFKALQPIWDFTHSRVTEVNTDKVKS